ncbi:hypothetical protein NN561_010014 [Cricetulus griseus]
MRAGRAHGPGDVYKRQDQGAARPLPEVRTRSARGRPADRHRGRMRAGRAHGPGDVYKRQDQGAARPLPEVRTRSARGRPADRHRGRMRAGRAHGPGDVYKRQDQGAARPLPEVRTRSARGRPADRHRGRMRAGRAHGPGDVYKRQDQGAARPLPEVRTRSARGRPADRHRGRMRAGRAHGPGRGGGGGGSGATAQARPSRAPSPAGRRGLSHVQTFPSAEPSPDTSRPRSRGPCAQSSGMPRRPGGGGWRRRGCRAGARGGVRRWRTRHGHGPGPWRPHRPPRTARAGLVGSRPLPEARRSARRERVRRAGACAGRAAETRAAAATLGWGEPDRLRGPLRPCRCDPCAPRPSDDVRRSRGSSALFLHTRLRGTLSPPRRKTRLHKLTSKASATRD